MQEFVSFTGGNAALFLPAPCSSFSYHLVYVGDFLSWNKLRDNTATTHRMFGLRNALFGRSLGLRVAPELLVTFRPWMQRVELVSWSGRPLVRNVLYLTGISLCIGRGFVFGSALWSVSLSLSLSLSSVLPLLLFLVSWLACRNRRPAHALSTTDDTLPLPPLTP